MHKTKRIVCEAFLYLLNLSQRKEEKKYTSNVSQWE